MGNIMLVFFKRGVKTAIALAAIVLLTLALMRLFKRNGSCVRN